MHVNHNFEKTLILLKRQLIIELILIRIRFWVE